MYELTEQQLNFFETFGYLVFRGRIKDDVAWIEKEFEQVFVDRGVSHEGDKRTCIVPFIDQRERLCTLVDHPALHSIAVGVLGEDFNYVGSVERGEKVASVAVVTRIGRALGTTGASLLGQAGL